MLWSAIGPIRHYETKLAIVLTILSGFWEYPRLLCFSFGAHMLYDVACQHSTTKWQVSAIVAGLAILIANFDASWKYGSVLPLMLFGPIGRAFFVPLVVIVHGYFEIRGKYYLESTSDLDPVRAAFGSILELIFTNLICISYGIILFTNLPSQAGNALRHTVRNSDIESLCSNLQAGTDPNSADRYGTTPLHICAQQAMYEAAVILMQYGADPNRQDKVGFTPLHWAVQLRTEEPSMANRIDLIRELIRKGADPQIRDMNGTTPMTIATRKGNSSALAALQGEDREDYEEIYRAQHTLLD